MNKICGLAKKVTPGKLISQSVKQFFDTKLFFELIFDNNMTKNHSTKQNCSKSLF